MRDLVRVVSACSMRAGLVQIYEKQLFDAGIGFYLSEEKLKYLGDLVDFWKKSLDMHGDAETVVFTDAWDVLFYGTAQEVHDKIPEDKVLLAAERNCWPDSYLADEIAGSTPWRYPNGGFSAGRPEAFSKWIEAVENHPAYHRNFINQQWYLHRCVDKSIEMTLDTKTELVYCMFMDSGEMQFDTRPYNTITGTRPNFVHFNGQSNPSFFLFRAEQKALVTA